MLLGKFGVSEEGHNEKYAVREGHKENSAVREGQTRDLQCGWDIMRTLQ